MIGCIVFWQRMLTPHMTELAREAARLGVEVNYVAEEALSDARRTMGWTTEGLAEVQIHLIKTRRQARHLVDRFPAGAVHITQGVRSNGLVGAAQKRIMKLGRRHYPIMEKVDLRSHSRWIKSLLYALRFWAMAGRIEGLLAIGDGTAAWIARRAPIKMRIIPFGYFLMSRLEPSERREASVFRLIFVGSLIPLKRVDLLIRTLSGLTGYHFTLDIIGDGPKRRQLENQAAASLSDRVTFVGTLPMGAAIARIATADCLILPSDHDGWGAVISEAQINGTPVICSSECGAAGTVRASSFGTVFEAGNEIALRNALTDMLNRGVLGALGREKLSAWARSLTAEAGSRYLIEIIDSEDHEVDHIHPPWER